MRHALIRFLTALDVDAAWFVKLYLIIIQPSTDIVPPTSSQLPINPTLPVTGTFRTRPQASSEQPRTTITYCKALLGPTFGSPRKPKITLTPGSSRMVCVGRLRAALSHLGASTSRSLVRILVRESYSDVESSF